MSERKGTGVMSKNTVIFDNDKLSAAIKKSGITMNKLSKLVLNRGDTYVSEALKYGRCNSEDLKKLCDFLDLNYDDMIVKVPENPVKEEVLPKPSEVVNLDALILGVNQLYQIEKQNGELLGQLVEQVRATNVKLSRFENLIGQMHVSTLAIKETAKDVENVMRENKSSVAGIAGRVRDLSQKFK